MIGRLLCRRGRHDWDVSRIVHVLAWPAEVAMTYPARESTCKRCHLSRTEPL